MTSTAPLLPEAISPEIASPSRAMGLGIVFVLTGFALRVTTRQATA